MDTDSILYQNAQQIRVCFTLSGPPCRMLLNPPFPELDGNLKQPASMNLSNNTYQQIVKIDEWKIPSDLEGAEEKGTTVTVILWENTCCSEVRDHSNHLLTAY